MAEAPDTSIDTSSPLSPASSALSTPPDASDRLKSPWSQIVRGSANPPRSKPADPPSCSPQPDEHSEKLPHQQVSSELRVLDTDAAVVNTSPISSSSIDSRQGADEALIEASATSPDRLINESGPFDSKPSQQSPAKSPKVAWGKLPSNPVQSLEPEPVMGAVAWPALSEARNPKSSESSKAAAVQKSGSKPISSSNERHHLQAPPLLQREIGVTDQSLVNQELISQGTVNGIKLQSSAVKDSPSSRKIMQPADAEHSKWSGGKDSKVAAASEGSPGHTRGTGSGHTSNKESTRNFMWEQGRGNHSFPVYGRGHASVREQTLPGHQQQRGGQRNLPQPYVPFVNPNPGFVYPAGYQNVPGGMYYMPAPTAEPVLGATYFVPPGVQGMFMPGPDILTVQGMVVKQIEYYFSVENLCRDIYLRSKMDEWGFVPVSVIANFNRVRAITPNPYFIIEALRLSNVVEVQGDKIRKKGDWANWLLPTGQSSATSSGDRDQAVRFSTSSKKAEVDHLKSDNLRPVGADNQSNGHFHLASQIRERVEALSVTAVNAQGGNGNQDSLSQEGMVGSFGDGRLEDLHVDGVDRHFAQSCGVESGHLVE
ncbi:hypothetical protein GOP47_0021669 [Adiantum capillus-veneris]|uniref:HTH La-type RNA-binding domain-containing protein n=1 Tax=Adiantum capillus-veneris TaxID=13818 RepID=A0A9D4U887_ADICA|nr:hypothetical protein GOP47_0021669 [Adiantum capillus-veneris]